MKYLYNKVDFAVIQSVVVFQKLFQEFKVKNWIRIEE
jgi:hypothetical protein